MTEKNKTRKESTLNDNDLRNGERPIPPKNLINAAELVQRQWRPRTWLLWQMIPRGGITLLAGETASGKTFLGLDLALGMASDRGKAWDMEIADSSWLIANREQETLSALLPGQAGDRNVTGFPISYQRSTMSCGAPVRYFCADADPNLIAERVARLCRGYPNPKKTTGIDVPTNLDFDFSALQFNDPTGFTWLQNEIGKKGYQLIVFDSLAQYLPAMADGSARAVGAFLGGLRQLVSSTGVTILLLHQFNKRLPARTDKWGLPISQGEERVRGTSELLAGVDTALLLSRPEATTLGVRAQTLLRVVKNRLGQAGARLRFSIVDGEPTNADGVGVLPNSLHLLFERPAEPAPLKPRRLVDATFDEMMHILMRQDYQKFTRAELTKQLQQRMDLPTIRSLTEAFRLLGKDDRVRVERDETGKKHYSWAEPGTGEMERMTYGLPPIMAFDLGSRWAWSKTQELILRAEVEKMEGKDKNSELVERLTAFVKEQEAKPKEPDS